MYSQVKFVSHKKITSFTYDSNFLFYFLQAEDLKKQADENREGQVEVYPSPNDIIKNSDIVLCCVSDPAAVKDVR